MCVIGWSKGYSIFLGWSRVLYCSAKSKSSICLFVKWADTAFWLCTAVYVFKEYLDVERLIPVCYQYVLFQTQMEGLTGRIAFDERGLRVGFSLKVFGVTVNGRLADVRILSAVQTNVTAYFTSKQLLLFSLVNCLNSQCVAFIWHGWSIFQLHMYMYIVNHVHFKNQSLHVFATYLTTLY